MRRGVPAKEGENYRRALAEAEAKTGDELWAELNSLLSRYDKPQLALDTLRSEEMCTLMAVVFHLLKKTFDRLAEAAPERAEDGTLTEAWFELIFVLQQGCRLGYAIAKNYPELPPADDLDDLAATEGPFTQAAPEMRDRSDGELVAVVNSFAERFRHTALSFDVDNDPQLTRLGSAAFELLTRLLTRAEAAEEREQAAEALVGAARIFVSTCKLAYGLGRGYLDDPAKPPLA